MSGAQPLLFTRRATTMTGMRFGPFRIPRFLALRVSVVTRLAGPGWHVDVRIAAPIIGLLCRWHGFMEFR